MEDWRHVIVLVCVAIYMVSCIAIGLWAMWRTKSTHDFFMAGRNLGILVTGIAIFSSTMSGFGFVGGPSWMYQMGMSSVWIVVAIPIGYCICFHLLGKRIRLFGELCDSVSLPDVVAIRYRSETSRLLTALAILLGVVGYLGSQIKAMSVVLQKILEALIVSDSESKAVPLWLCVAISCAVLVFYCVTGGILASVYTDLIQGLVMLVAAILVFFAAMSAVQGGFAGITATLSTDNPESIGPWGTLGMLGCLSWFFVFALGVVGQPHVITKMMMNKKISDARHILPLSVLGYMVVALLWISIGLAMRTLVLNGEHPVLGSIEEAAPSFLQHYTHPLLHGIVIAGLFAAIMSTADGFLNIGAAAVVHDMPKAIIGRPVKNELFWARMATLLITVAAAFMALYWGRLVAILGAFGWGTFAAALVPVVAIGFNWKRATAAAANTAIVAGLVINLGVKLADKIWSVKLPYGFDGGALALLVSLTLFFGISLLSKPPKLDEDVEAVMDL